MIHPTHPNFAFIDNQNLYMAVRDMGWEIDYSRLFIWLRQKHRVSKAFMFLGYIENNAALYTRLQKAGFIVIFRPTLKYKDGTVKGNCDTELVLQAVHEMPEYEKAIVISGDGDFYSLYEYLLERNKLHRITIPNRAKHSALLRKFTPHMTFLSDRGVQDKLKKRQ